MFIVNQSEGWSILNGEKVETLRPIKANGKGYFKIGSIQRIYIGRNFKAPALCRVLVYNRTFVNIHDLSIADFNALGYPSKAEYLAQPYNKGNPSSDRVRYQFIELSHLLDWIENCNKNPITFAQLMRYVQFNSDLMVGVSPVLPWDNVEKSDIVDRFHTVAYNLRRVINDQ